MTYEYLIRFDGLPARKLKAKSHEQAAIRAYWAVDVFDGRRAWTKTHLGEQPLNKAEAHRLAHKLRDPKFYSVRTKRAVNSGGAL